MAAFLFAGCNHGSSRSTIPATQKAPGLNGPSSAKHFEPLPAPEIIHDADIDRQIDPDVSAADRATLQSLMRDLPENARLNVILLTKGRAIANHKVLTAGAVIAPPGAKTFINAHGEEVTAPQRFTAANTARKVKGVRPPTSDQNGPFVRTWNGSNHSYITSWPTLPCNATPDNPPGRNNGVYGDTGYIYFANFTPFDDYEGGLQYSSTYSWYVPYQTDTHDGQGQFSAPPGYEIACGQNYYNLTYQVQFFVVKDDELAIHYRGRSARDANRIIDITLARLPGVGSGWSAPCLNCTLSMTTSIAQYQNTSLGYWKDGYVFGAKPQYTTLSFNWQQTELGDCRRETNYTTVCDNGLKNELQNHDLFPNDHNQVYWNYGDTFYTMSHKDGIALATDRNQAPLAPASQTRGGESLPENTPAYCDADDYGACGNYTVIGNSQCNPDAENVTYSPQWMYKGYSALTGQTTDFWGYSTPMSGQCYQFTIQWQPTDPQTYYGDPNLPGAYNMPVGP